MYDTEAVWQAATTYESFVNQAEKHVDLWHGVYRTARIPGWAFERVPEERRYRLLAIAEDWCGDAINTLPVIAKWASGVPSIDLRVVRRDEHPDVMARYLTNGAKAIPIVAVWDDEGNELGVWGPRPAELQRWVMDHKDSMPSKERYPHVRRWYARDRGRTTLEELLEIISSSNRDHRVSGDRPVLQPS